MIRTLLTSAVFAGIVAGLTAALLQFLFVIPPLLEGELYETGARVHFATNGSPQSISQAPGLGEILSGDWGRHTMTVAFNIVTYTGYALLLAALMLAVQVFDLSKTLTTRTGLIWGLCGFIAVQLAPAMGQPPVLPGTIGAEVGARQLWWMITILATASGLGLIAFGRLWMVVLGVVLILAPQLYGAPQLDTYFGVTPPELAARFATLSLGAAAVGWVILGGAVAFFLQRFDH